MDGLYFRADRLPKRSLRMSQNGSRASATRRLKGRLGRRFRPQVETLEDRTVPATFNIYDGDVVGLVTALTTASMNREDDTINLASGGHYLLTKLIPGPGVGLGAGLPRIESDDGHA